MSILEQLLRASASPRLPDDERRDVNAELFQTFMSGLSSRDLVEVDPEDIRADMIALAGEGSSLRKAVVLESSYYAMAYPKGQERGPGHKSILFVNQMGVLGPGNSERWADKPSLTGGFEFLRYMVGQVDLLQAIIQTRIRQVSAFCRPYDENDNNPLGYRFVRRDGERFTEDDERATKRLEKILQNSGTEFDPRVRRWQYRRRTFQGFIEALTADTLTADACPIETELTRDGGCAGWYNMPFDTIRLAYEDGYDGDDSIVAIQLAPEGHIPVVGFTHKEIIYETRNPRSALAMHDYGMSENEVLLRAMTSYLNAFTFNSAALDRNAIPRGFLTLYGRFGKKALNDFRTRWNAMMRGAAHKWNLPVLVAPSKQEGGAVYTPVDTQTHEMLQSQWIIFLSSLACALHGMAPEEINVKSFSPQSSGLAGKDTSEKLQSGRDKGLIPLMLWLENLLNDHLMLLFSGKYRLTWVGLYPEDEERKQKRLEATSTVDEMRAIDGQEPHENPLLGKAPVNPVHMSLYSQQVMQQQQMDQAQQQGGDEQPGWGEEDQHPSGLPDSERPSPYLRPDQPSPDGSPPPGGPSQAPPSNGRPQPFGGGGFAKAPMPGAPRLLVEIRELGPAAPERRERRTPRVDPGMTPRRYPGDSPNIDIVRGQRRLDEW